MGFIIGTIKFIVGVVLGAATGAAVTTYIVTRDGGQTVTQLQTMVNNMMEAGREAYEAEEKRMSGRYNQLVGDAAKERKTKMLESKKDDDKQ